MKKKWENVSLNNNQIFNQIDYIPYSGNVEAFIKTTKVYHHSAEMGFHHHFLLLANFINLQHKNKKKSVEIICC